MTTTSVPTGEGAEGRLSRPPSSLTSAVLPESLASTSFSAAPHQVAGHLFERGKVGSLVCDSGYFYKPLQKGSRGVRERAFYEQLSASSMLGDGLPEDDASTSEEEGAPTISLRNLAPFVPRFYGTLELGGITYMKLEDLSRQYKNPCIIDVKIGYQTWYPSATQSHIDKCKVKDLATTQSKLGFKICGMQVYDRPTDRLVRADKDWCKLLDCDSVVGPLQRFLNPPSSQDLSARDLCFGEGGLLGKLEDLEQYFERQRGHQFFSSSLLVVYEGGAVQTTDLNLQLKLIDFAHAITVTNARDENFLNGLKSFKSFLLDFVV